MCKIVNLLSAVGFSEKQVKTLERVFETLDDEGFGVYVTLEPEIGKMIVLISPRGDEENDEEVI